MTDTTRAEFEAWADNARPHQRLRGSTTDNYDYLLETILFECWQAAPVPQQEQGKRQPLSDGQIAPMLVIAGPMQNYNFDAPGASPDADHAEWFRAMLAASPVTLQEQGKRQPAYPEGDVVGPCVCGSWPGGKCLKCPWISTTAQRQPLRSEQIYAIFLKAFPKQMRGMDYVPEWAIPVARAIEAAHGITATPPQGNLP